MKKLLLLLFIGLAIFSLVKGYRFYISSVDEAARPNDHSRVMVTIEPGDSASKIAGLLHDRALIKSPRAFRFYLKQKKLEGAIQTGRRVLSPSQTMAEIVETLTAPKTQELPVTILEGWTIRQMAEYLASLGLTTEEQFLNCVKTCSFKEFDFLPTTFLEGYLYPDTYFVDPDSFSEERLIKRLIQTFRNRLEEDWVRIPKSRRSLKEIVIIASIVEREERNLKERPRVAGILWKRYEADRGLDADATILYALGRTKGGLSYEDLKTDSLYNTRKYRGLPPTPISNPSLSSLRAALYPEKSLYWYYLHDKEGQVHYGKTLEEHNENKVKYLKNSKE